MHLGLFSIVLAAGAVFPPPARLPAGSPLQSAAGVCRRNSAIVGADVRPAAGSIAQAEWLAGTWTGAAGPNSIEERWTPAASGAMLAVGRTLRDGGMRSFEFLCIVEHEGSLAYTAMPNGQTPPTFFMLTAITADSMTFENPSHDYPKVIQYRRLPDGTLQTTASGGGSDAGDVVVLKRQ